MALAVVEDVPAAALELTLLADRGALGAWVGSRVQSPIGSVGIAEKYVTEKREKGRAALYGYVLP